MANIKSQKKRNLTNAKTAATGDGEGLDEKLLLAQRRLDKAATKGVIHKNQAARRTSRLMKAANKHEG